LLGGAARTAGGVRVSIFRLDVAFDFSGFLIPAASVEVRLTSLNCSSDLLLFCLLLCAVAIVGTSTIAAIDRTILPDIIGPAPLLRAFLSVHRHASLLFGSHVTPPTGHDKLTFEELLTERVWSTASREWAD
jgi:hypothetical protein